MHSDALHSSRSEEITRAVAYYQCPRRPVADEAHAELIAPCAIDCGPGYTVDVGTPYVKSLCRACQPAELHSGLDGSSRSWRRPQRADAREVLSGLGGWARIDRPHQERK